MPRQRSNAGVCGDGVEPPGRANFSPDAEVVFSVKPETPTCFVAGVGELPALSAVQPTLAAAERRYSAARVAAEGDWGDFLAGMMDTLDSVFYGDLARTSVTLRRRDSRLEFDWRKQPLDQAKAADRWSARWTGNLSVPESGRYRLRINNGSNVRATLDGSPMDRWVYEAKRSRLSGPGPHQ